MLKWRVEYSQAQELSTSRLRDRAGMLTFRKDLISQRDSVLNFSGIVRYATEHEVTTPYSCTCSAKEEISERSDEAEWHQIGIDPCGSPLIASI